MNVLPEALEVLTSRLDALEKRVHDLEHSAEACAPPEMQLATVASDVAGESAFEQANGVIPVLGGAMLGIAGAYVLRAFAESSFVPRQAIAAVAIAYAAAWLVWAARTGGTASFARAIYAGTSTLILAPMLWELTLRFNVLSPALAAGVLSGFVIAATVLAWKRDLTPVFWLAYGAAALTAVALSIATHAFLPFLFSLLLMVLLSEFAALRGHGQSIRLLVAAVADVAVWALIFIYSGPLNARADYPALGAVALLAPACGLFLLNAASVAWKTALLRQKITVFETVQCIIAFLLAVSSVLFFQPGSGTLVLGVTCILLSAASYWVAFANFRHAAEQRNFKVFAAWSAGLLLAGLLWALPPASAAVCLGLAALTAIFLASRYETAALEFHGVIYLAAASVASGLLEYAFHALAGPPAAKPSWSIFLVFVFAFFCYATGDEQPGEDWQKQFFHLIPALLASCAVAALLAQGLLRLAAFFLTPDVFHVAFTRTLAICFVALALAFGGARWRRLQMTRIAYAALAFEAAKLVFEDLRHGRMEFIAASFFLFAMTLIAVPRLARIGSKQ
jgi:hypothetical protein